MTKARDLANASTALSAVSATELGYVDGVTSAIQTQLDAKATSSTVSTHTGASTGVHGITGSVVGTTDTQTLSGKTLTSPSINYGGFVAPKEYWQSVGTGFAGFTYNILDGGVVYIWAGATANGAINFRGNAGTTLASVIPAQNQVTVILMITNGGTAQYPTSLTIDGSAPRTIKWSGGTAPSSGNASSVDIYSFTLMHAQTGPDVWDIFAAGPIKYA